MEKPETTAAMSELDAFLNKTRNVTMFDLQDKMAMVKAQLLFLLEHTEMISEDMKLTTTTLGWPERLDPMFDMATRRIDEHRSVAEVALKARTAEFEQSLCVVLASCHLTRCRRLAGAH